MAALASLVRALLAGGWTSPIGRTTDQGSREPGLASTVMRLVGNVAFRHGACQEALRSSGMLSVILSCCADDVHNPQLREWAVLALRNACEGSEANQRFVDSIERTPRDVVNAQDLENAGLEVRVDRESGKLRVRHRQAASEPACSPSQTPFH